MNTYRNYHPIAYMDERFVPVPGWGMHPVLAGGRTIAIGGMHGLGLDIPIKTPIGTQTISVPVESAAKAAAEAAWPVLQKKMEAELPKLVSKAVAQAQPKLRAEIDRGLKEAKKTGYVIGFFVVAAIAASAWWVKKG